MEIIKVISISFIQRVEPILATVSVITKKYGAYAFGIKFNNDMSDLLILHPDIDTQVDGSGNYTIVWDFYFNHKEEIDRNLLY
ncbi:hypothetical protein [Sphingobacterium hungaricum]|uniref:Uncharacterized protein n=1 Tax=Sphingobacterium hungaricum TaxID=2082723 RepID=A0A928UST5_9SPHI|nr:hypothetical protein [Sphingobacterium hungaricum]MBE8712666.1 hypothetical protein [Sphingobacterium hungaricum]